MKNQSAILQILNGDRGCNDNIRCSPEYSKALDKVVEFEEKLTSKLKLEPDLYKLFEDFNDALRTMHCEEVDDYYLEGFRFGALIGIDIMTPPNE